MQKKIPQRQCMGCRERRAKRELIRVVRTPEGSVNLDTLRSSGKLSGSGHHAVSSLRYTPAEQITWRMVFRLKTRPDVNVPILP